MTAAEALKRYAAGERDFRDADLAGADLAGAIGLNATPAEPYVRQASLTCDERIARYRGKARAIKRTLAAYRKQLRTKLLLRLRP